MPGLADSRQPDPTRVTRLTDVTEDPAHLRDPADARFTLDRVPANPRVQGLLRRLWIPVWDVPHGEVSPQRVLQYPICLAVVAADYARFYGVVRGLSGVELRGRGWAFGAMLTPAAGYLISGRSVDELSDRHVPLESVPLFAGYPEQIRVLLAADPHEPTARREAQTVLERRLDHLLPLDDESLLINEIVEQVETDPTLLSVTDLAERFGLTERSLQRLCRKRLGLTPHWLIRRRRLHDAAAALHGDAVDLAGLAIELGYADQAHFSRDFRVATGMTPREFHRRQTSRPG